MSHHAKAAVIVNAANAKTGKTKFITVRKTLPHLTALNILNLHPTQSCPTAARQRIALVSLTYLPHCFLNKTPSGALRAFGRVRH
jgi:hypothetical protein